MMPICYFKCECYTTSNKVGSHIDVTVPHISNVTFTSLSSKGEEIGYYDYHVVCVLHLNF